jgi:hypothetical protein
MHPRAGVDAIGIDYCGGPSDVEIEYQKFADGIVKSGRDMQLGTVVQTPAAHRTRVIDCASDLAASFFNLLSVSHS